MSEGIRAILSKKDHYILHSSKGIDEPSMLRSGWCSCITRDLSRRSFLWSAMLPNISGCSKLKSVRVNDRQMFAYFSVLITFCSPTALQSYYATTPQHVQYIPASIKVEGNLIAETSTPLVQRVFCEILRRMWRWFFILDRFLMSL